MWGHNWLHKNSGGCLGLSDEGPSSRQTSIDKTNDCVMISERSAFFSGSDPPQGLRLHTRPIICGGRRPWVRKNKNSLDAGVHKSDDNSYRAVPNIEIILWGRRRTMAFDSSE